MENSENLNKSKIQIVNNKFVVDVDDNSSKLEIILNGLKMLKETTSEISQEAASAAASLYKQLKETKYRFFNVIDSINDLIIIKDSSGKWKTVNYFTQNLLTLNDKDYIGKTNIEIAKQIPKFSGYLSKCKLTDDETWDRQSISRYVETLEVDEKTYYFDMVKTPVFTSDGEKDELIAIGRDITDFKKQEVLANVYSNLFKSAEDIILIVNKNRNIVFYNNNNFLDFFDLSNKAIYTFSDIHDCFAESDYSTIWANLLNNYCYSKSIVLEIDDKHKRVFVNAVPLSTGKVDPELFIFIIKKVV
jgi:PAS domain-containing protein